MLAAVFRMLAAVFRLVKVKACFTRVVDLTYAVCFGTLEFLLDGFFYNLIDAFIT